MIPKKKREAITQYYNDSEVKNVTKTANKFNITRKSVYRVLDEFGVSISSKIRENEDNVMELVQDYLDSDKTIGTIERIANKYDIKKKELISFLKQYNIETPKMFTRMDAIDWNDDKAKVNEISNEIDLDREMYSAVSVMQQFKEMGWDKKEGSERAKQLDYYIKTRYGIDSFKIYINVMEHMIINDGVFTLEKDLEAIKNGSFKLSSKSVETQIYDIMFKMTKDIFSEPDRVEPKVKTIEKPKAEPFFSEEFYETFLKMFNSTYYNTLMKVKEIRKQNQKQQALQTIKDVLGKPKPKPKVLETPKPEPREKRVIITGDDVAQYLMREE